MSLYSRGTNDDGEETSCAGCTFDLRTLAMTKMTTTTGLYTPQLVSLTRKGDRIYYRDGLHSVKCYGRQRHDRVQAEPQCVTT